MEGDDGANPVKKLRAFSVASRSWPAKTVMMRSGRIPLRTAARTPGRILPAAQPHTEFTTTMVVPFCFTAFSTSAAVRASWMPAEVSSSRMGAIIISGYIHFLPMVVKVYFTGKKRFSQNSICGLVLGNTFDDPGKHSSCPVYHLPYRRTGTLFHRSAERI